MADGQSDGGVCESWALVLMPGLAQQMPSQPLGCVFSAKLRIVDLVSRDS